jgi:hypothetical protein
MSKALTPLKAIRAKCLDCSGGSFREVKECPIEDCPLYAYRMGHNPARAGKGGRALGRGLAIAQESPIQQRGSEQESAKEPSRGS